jgi:hypothetical protein
MDPIIAAVNLADDVVRVVRYLRLSPTRAVRAAEEGFPLVFMRRLEWNICRGGLLSRLARRESCGCSSLRRTFVLFDFDCPIHDPFNTALLDPMQDGDSSVERVDT